MFLVLSIFTKPDTRKSILSSPLGFLNIWNRKYSFLQIIKRKLNILITTVSQAILVAFIYIFMEWLFFVTKPSFMAILTFGEKTSVLFVSSFSLWLLITVAILTIFCLDVLFSALITPFDNFFLLFACLMNSVRFGPYSCR